MHFERILCPIDFSEFSAAAYQHPPSLAEYYKARLVATHLVEHWQYPFADYAAQEVDYMKFCKSQNESAEVQLREFLPKYPDHGIHPELVIHPGNASDCIL